MNAFVTYLATDAFVPGLLVLDQSLKAHKNDAPLVVMVTRMASRKVVNMLTRRGFDLRMADDILNPNKLASSQRNFSLLYTKLNVFSMTEFEKIVYLDLDMLVCDRIVGLFAKPHMSAVVAGALAAENAQWVDLNSGLMVVEPSKELFNEMFDKVSTLPSQDGSDQGFLHSFFPQWKHQSELHLDHGFNLPCGCLDQYCERPDFEFSYSDGKLVSKNIFVLHYWGVPKPWQMERGAIQSDSARLRQAIQLWWDCFDISIQG
jgi:alpha-N-acetylglucosamine transferase